MTLSSFWNSARSLFNFTHVMPQPISTPKSCGITFSVTVMTSPIGATLPGWISGIIQILLPAAASLSHIILTCASA